MIGEKSTERFFEQTLPAFVVASLDRFARSKGTLAFSCAGQKYTVRLGDLETPVVPGFDRRADCKMWFKPGEFEAFLEGTLHPGSAFRMEGDWRVLDRFGRFLSDSDVFNQTAAFAEGR